VCDDFWGQNDAMVACMQYSAQNNYGWTPSTLSVVASSRALYGPGPASEPIWLDDVVCSGTETTLTACQHQPIGTHNCIHDEDAGVECITGSTPAPTTGPVPAPSDYVGRIRCAHNVDGWIIRCSITPPPLAHCAVP
jgi:hypothetical protein